MNNTETKNTAWPSSSTNVGLSSHNPMSLIANDYSYFPIFPFSFLLNGITKSVFYINKKCDEKPHTPLKTESKSKQLIYSRSE